MGDTMRKHRTFHADRFLDKFEDHPEILRGYLARWDGCCKQIPSCTLDAFKDFLVNGSGDGKEAMIEGLYRAADLSTDKGHGDLLATCRERGYDPDPEGSLPVE